MTVRLLLVIIVLVIFDLFAVPYVFRAQESSFTGHPYVVDGDSLRMGQVNIRLAGIDAPELEQTCLDATYNSYRCGLLATSALEEFIGGREVTCFGGGTDIYGRTLATCSVSGHDLGDYMVRSGNAIAYERYSQAYLGAQEEAQTAKRGLWAGSFLAPEQWRHPQ